MKSCATCLTPCRRVYCSRICRIRDQLWLEARTTPVVGADGGADYSAIADAVGVSRDFARVICIRALAKLRKRLTARGIDGSYVKRPVSMLGQAQDWADDFFEESA
jgi:hypothetical protein